MVKANGFCKYAIKMKTSKLNGSTIKYGTECEKGYKKCTGQGCKCFEGNQDWDEYQVKRAAYKSQWA